MTGQGREWLRVVVTAVGLVGTALATVYVIRTGVSATTESTPRTVVATIAPADPGTQPKAATRTADAWAGLERPIMVTAPTPVSPGPDRVRLGCSGRTVTWLATPWKTSPELYFRLMPLEG